MVVVPRAGVAGRGNCVWVAWSSNRAGAGQRRSMNVTASTTHDAHPVGSVQEPKCHACARESVCLCCPAPQSVILAQNSNCPASKVIIRKYGGGFGCHVSRASPKFRQAKGPGVLAGVPRLDSIVGITISGSVFPSDLSSDSVLSLAGNHSGESMGSHC
jgi:hypothetical protein